MSYLYDDLGNIKKLNPNRRHFHTDNDQYV